MSRRKRKDSRQQKPRSHMPPPERVIPDAKKEASRRACREPLSEDESTAEGEGGPGAGKKA